jgi:hypothetical protein
MLNKTTLGVTLRVIVTPGGVILVPVAGGVSKQDSILALGLPVLLESVFKASSNILWSITTACSLKRRYEFFGCLNILTEGKDLTDLFPITMISVGNDRYSDLNAEVLIADALNDGLDLLLASFNPAAHGTCAIDDKHDIETLASEERLPHRLKSDKVKIYLSKTII